MDTTRISIARVLALDVPLTWQDAVAVAQEAAMLNDVHAAMNSRPSLVSAEACFITRTGDLELPHTTDVESPDAVAALLREMLAGRDAPEALEALAFGHATRDMSGALQQFPLANRRAEIAKLATRALGLQARPADAVPAVAPSPPIPPILPDTAAGPAAVGASHAASPDDDPTPASQFAEPADEPSPSLVLPFVMPASAATGSTTSRGGAAAPTFVRDAPFRATSAPRTAAPAASPPVPMAPTAPDAELRRLRKRTAEREKTRRRLSKRLSLAVGRFSRWVTWRPSSPDPRILGAAVVVTAAVVSVVWTDDRTPSPPGSSAESAGPTEITIPTIAVTPGAAAPGSGLPGSPPVVSLPSLPGGGAGITLPDLTSPRAGAGRRGAPKAGGRAAAAPASEVAAPAASVERGAAPAGSRGGVTVTVPALDPTPDPLTGATSKDTRLGLPREAIGEGRGEGRMPVYSANDADVEPPVMLRQHLPSTFIEPTPDAPDDWPFLELLIDHRGAVEQVRLHANHPAPGQTLYRHRMLLAAAKAWQFEPARRHGTPVRYVMRVPLEP